MMCVCSERMKLEAHGSKHRHVICVCECVYRERMMCWRHTAAKFLSLGVDIDEVDPTGECASIKIRTSSKLCTSSKIRTITPSTC